MSLFGVPTNSPTALQFYIEIKPALKRQGQDVTLTTEYFTEKFTADFTTTKRNKREKGKEFLVVFNAKKVYIGFKEEFELVDAKYKYKGKDEAWEMKDQVVTFDDCAVEASRQFYDRNKISDITNI